MAKKDQAKMDVFVPCWSAIYKHWHLLRADWYWYQQLELSLHVGIQDVACV